MKKKITAILLSMMLAVPISGTYVYKPVSSQAWYKSYQETLKTVSNIKYNIKINYTYNAN